MENMKNNSLSKKGLSLSQAQSISNLCNQRAMDIKALLGGINNASKYLLIGDTKYIDTNPKPLPENVVDLLTELSLTHACQAFLMENIKAKDTLIKEIKNEKYIPEAFEVKAPTYINTNVVPTVDENWGWSQLTKTEINEYIEAESYAAHIGQFIHKNGTLDVLRKELPNIKTLEWIEVKKDEKTPLNVVIHHTPEKLLTLHNELATIHRKYEQRVNYFKAKVKNLTADENARIEKDNAVKISEDNALNKKLRDAYTEEYRIYSDAVLVKTKEFESDKELRRKEASSLRIEIFERFKPLVDKYEKML